RARRDVEHLVAAAVEMPVLGRGGAERATRGLVDRERRHRHVGQLDAEAAAAAVADGRDLREDVTALRHEPAVPAGEVAAAVVVLGEHTAMAIAQPEQRVEGAGRDGELQHLPGARLEAEPARAADGQRAVDRRTGGERLARVAEAERVGIRAVVGGPYLYAQRTGAARDEGEALRATLAVRRQGSDQRPAVEVGRRLADPGHDAHRQSIAADRQRTEVAGGDVEAPLVEPLRRQRL